MRRFLQMGPCRNGICFQLCQPDMGFLESWIAIHSLLKILSCLLFMTLLSVYLSQFIGRVSARWIRFQLLLELRLCSFQVLRITLICSLCKQGSSNSEMYVRSCRIEFQDIAVFADRLIEVALAFMRLSGGHHAPCRFRRSLK